MSRAASMMIDMLELDSSLDSSDTWAASWRMISSVLATRLMTGGESYDYKQWKTKLFYFHLFFIKGPVTQAPDNKNENESDKNARPRMVELLHAEYAHAYSTG